MLQNTLPIAGQLPQQCIFDPKCQYAKVNPFCKHGSGIILANPLLLRRKRWSKKDNSQRYRNVCISYSQIHIQKCTRAKSMTNHDKRCPTTEELQSQSRLTTMWLPPQCCCSMPYLTPYPMPFPHLKLLHCAPWNTRRRTEPLIKLFIKAGTDGERTGNCPLSQRLFMILWLKGVVFSVTIADLKRRPADLQNLSLRTHPPSTTFNNEVKTNVNKIEEFLEDIVCPPKYLELSPKHAESNTAGMDVFAKFSAYIKNSRPEANEALVKSLLKTLQKLNEYLNPLLPDEIDKNSREDITFSIRKFPVGNEMTLADLLPKLHIVKVVAKKYHNFDIPERMTGIWSYLTNAYKRDEFTNTCPHGKKIEIAYSDVSKKLNK
ncbi:chloride intracellular channel protein 4-like [Gorilla gorilla gorilla]|uniref:chloride intracellular channel protein 4-like n=1 Tax=Gorilla gorilla gorilla TaxID=9595 RepID=UPI00300B1F6D